MTQISSIYFVDDSDDEVFITRLALERSRIDVELLHFFDLDAYFTHLAQQRTEALSSAMSVLDMNLTLTKGTDGIARLRAESLLAGHIAGICSGSDDPADRQAALDAGADFFVAKPLNLHALRGMCAVVPELQIHDDEGVLWLSRTLDLRTTDVVGRQVNVH